MKRDYRQGSFRIQRSLEDILGERRVTLGHPVSDEASSLRAINAELLEMAEAFAAYLRDDSRSPRRREECLRQCEELINRAKEQQ